MKIIPKQNSQYGFSVVFLIVGVIAVILIIGYLGIQPGGFLSKQLVQNVPSQTSTIPSEQWLTYEGTAPKFSVKYPADWSYQIRNSSESGNLIVLQFIPKNSNDAVAKINNVTLRVLDKNKAVSLQDWVNKYTTNLPVDDPEVQGKGYTLYKVRNISNTTIEGKEVINFTIDTVAGGEADGKIIASDKHIFIVIGLRGKAEDVRNKILQSLLF